MLPKIIIIKKDLVLIGGGHAHLFVIKNFIKNPIDGIRLTLITDKTSVAYSGMLPGYIEGIYSKKDANIDLMHLINKSQIRFIKATVNNISAKDRTIFLKGRPSLAYDYLSINIGIQSSFNEIPGAYKYTLPVKPISNLASKIEDKINTIKDKKPTTIVIIGAGPAGIELSLAIRKRLVSKNLFPKILLLCKYDKILHMLSNGASIIATNALKKAAIDINYNVTIKEFTKETIILKDNKKIKCKEPILATSGCAPNWIKKTDLSLTEDFFISVKDTLQDENYSNVFAAGDIAEIINNKRPKAGVYAVKSGKYLYKNICLLIKNKKLINYYPQKNYLSLIGLANGKVLVNKFGISITSKWLWKIKQKIDRNFIKKYSELPINTVASNSVEPFDYDMQCKGCASKIPYSVIDYIFNKNTSQGSWDADIIPNQSNLLQTIDMINSIVSDPYQLGIIATNHALNDIYASQASPVSAQLLIVMPQALNIIHKRDLKQIYAGINKIMNKSKCEINGGHTMTSEQPDISIGMAITGEIFYKKNINKVFSNTDKVIMTGKLGTSVLFSAVKKNLLSSVFLNKPIEQMLNGNKLIADILNKHPHLAITDITGFGLGNHLINIIKRYKKLNGFSIDAKSIPVFPGVVEAYNLGVKSSLHESNCIQAKKWIKKKNCNIKFDVLFDPQTCGGLVFIANKNISNKIITEFKNKKIDYTVIGKVNQQNKGILLV